LTNSISTAQMYQNHGRQHGQSNIELTHFQDQFQGNQSQQNFRNMQSSHINLSQQRPVSSTQRSNMKNIQASKNLKTTLSKSQIDKRGAQGNGREVSSSSEMLVQQNYNTSNQQRRNDSLTQSFNNQFSNFGAQ